VRRSRWLFRKSRSLVTTTPVLVVGQIGEGGVGGPVPFWKLRGVDAVVTGACEQPGELGRQLGVDDELHAAPSGTTRR
jgi:hypothetical protein